MNRRVGIVATAVASILLWTLVACGPSAPVTDPVAVTKAVFAAINEGKAEAAASYFAEDGELVTSVGQPKGQSKIRSFFQTTLIPLKPHLEIKEMNANDGTVTGVFTLLSVSDKTPWLMEVNAIVQNGKVKSMTWSGAK